MVASTGITRVAPGSCSRRGLFVAGGCFGSSFGGMVRASKSHQDGFLGCTMSLLPISLTWVDRVSVIKTAAHSISLNDLITHDWVLDLMSVSLRKDVGLVEGKLK